MNRDHAQSNINILSTRNLPIDSSVRQWSHPRIISLHCLWAKSNNGTRGQFDCDMTWFCFYFEFVRSHARCGCCSIVCWRGFVWNWRSKVKGWNDFGRRWTMGVGVLKIRKFLWTSYVYRLLIVRKNVFQI